MSHLTPDELGDVDEVAGHEHLRACERCRSLWQQQHDVRDLLRSLPDPGPLPSDVADELTAALGRLSSADVEAARPVEGGRPPASAATVVPRIGSSSRRERPGRARGWWAAAAAVVLLGGGGTALATHPWGGADQGSATAAGAAKESRSFTGHDAAGSTPVYATGTSYERATLPAQVEQRLLRGATTPVLPGGQAEGSGSSDDRRLATPEGLASCLAALDVPADHVTAVDLALFQGSPAAVVVVRDDTGGQDVWVVGRGCRQGDDQTLYFARVG